MMPLRCAQYADAEWTNMLESIELAVEEACVSSLQTSNSSKHTRVISMAGEGVKRER